MPDMLVKLYNLPKYDDLIDSLEQKNIYIRRAFAPDKGRILEFVRNISSSSAESEADVSFANRPISTFIATRNDEILGYAVYNATCIDFFGPTAVREDMRGHGIGKALLLRSLEAMYQEGFAYAIIGSAGPTGFYEKCCGARVIEDSTPGIYKDFLPNLKKQAL